MELFVWNINQQSSGQGIPRFVSEVIMESNADIVVLTEFISAAHKENIGKFIENLSEKYDSRYNEDRDKERRANGILIAVKKGFAEIISPAIERLVTHFSEQDQPNFLQAEIVVDGKPITIIGTRIQIDCKKSQSKSQEIRREEYNERRAQLLSLIEHINALENKNILIAGDFNNTCIHGKRINGKLMPGEEEKKYSEVRKYYRGKDLTEQLDTFDTYNYHIMKDDFVNNEMTVFTPKGEQYSHDFKFNDKKEILSDGYLKEDHIITKNLKVSNLKYCHSFIENHKNEIVWEQKWNRRKRGCEYIIDCPYPDHAILTADVKFDLPLQNEGDTQ
jgi:endonuclease/exonuclease/phosphatase family metal-dependent hydrolase